MRFKPGQLLAALAFGFASALAQAAYVVDTGTPNGSKDWVFSKNQYFAGEFALTGDYVLNSILGYFSTEAGTVDIAIHSDAGNMPGSILYSTSLATFSGGQNWNGASALNWSLTAGNYWVSFKPSYSGASTSMYGVVASPMLRYGQGRGNYVWANEASHYFDYLGIGVRIDATSIAAMPTAAVPEPSSILMYGAGLAGLALLVRRRST